MKRIVAIGLALVLVLTLGLVATASVGATDAVYDNWRGVLGGRDVTFEGHNYADAEGHVVFNYRKGQGDYIVNLVARGLNPGITYEVRINVNCLDTGDTIRQKFGEITANEDGVGHINVRGFTPEVTDFDESDPILRFLVVRPNGWRVLTTAEAGGGEDIEPVGSNRGE